MEQFLCEEVVSMGSICIVSLRSLTTSTRVTIQVREPVSYIQGAVYTITVNQVQSK